jgi:predicted glycoside hydrolase/deacetylase ChbG (UPF0249 family)
MRSHLLLIPLSFLLTLNLIAQPKTTAERLGYPVNSKLLIIHADDLGVAHSEDAASFDALDKNVVNSASIMMPTPWVTEVAAYAKAHPDADLGLHLTLTSEWKTYRWGAVAPSDQVESLLDSDGTFYNQSQLVAAHAKPQEAEREIRAQIDRAIALGIHPTHLDSHMASLFSTPELFAVYLKVAHDYHLPFLAGFDNSHRPAGVTDKDVVPDVVLIANPSIPRDHWKDFYLNAIKNMKPGLTELVVHLGHDDAELQAVTVDFEPYGSAWRQRDYDVLNSADFKKALQDNNIILVKWRDIQKLVN